MESIEHRLISCAKVESIASFTLGHSLIFHLSGLSRKAQLALQIKRFLSKHPKSTLADAFPHTVIVETWNAFEDIKLDFGPGVIASFGDSNLMQLPLRQRLDMTLDDLKYEFELDGREGWHWILKPSVTNKGLNSKNMKPR